MLYIALAGIRNTILDINYILARIFFSDIIVFVISETHKSLYFF